MQACHNVGGAMNFGVKRKLRNARRLDNDKVVIPLAFTSQGALHANFRTSYEMWAVHWASCEEGRNADAQGALVRLSVDGEGVGRGADGAEQADPQASGDAPLC